MTPIRRDFPVFWRHRRSVAAPSRKSKRSWAAPGLAEGEAGWTGLPGLTINRRSRASGPRRAQVAQLVEHATENRSVGGSIPPLGTILFNEINRVRSGDVFSDHGILMGDALGTQKSILPAPIIKAPEWLNEI